MLRKKRTRVFACTQMEDQDLQRLVYQVVENNEIAELIVDFTEFHFVTAALPLYDQRKQWNGHSDKNANWIYRRLVSLGNRFISTHLFEHAFKQPNYADWCSALVRYFDPRLVVAFAIPVPGYLHVSRWCRQRFPELKLEDVPWYPLHSEFWRATRYSLSPNEIEKPLAKSFFDHLFTDWKFNFDQHVFSLDFNSADTLTHIFTSAEERADWILPMDQSQDNVDDEEFIHILETYSPYIAMNKLHLTTKGIVCELLRFTSAAWLEQLRVNGGGQHRLFLVEQKGRPNADTGRGAQYVLYNTLPLYQCVEEWGLDKRKELATWLLDVESDDLIKRRLIYHVGLCPISIELIKRLQNKTPTQAETDVMTQTLIYGWGALSTLHTITDSDLKIWIKYIGSSGCDPAVFFGDWPSSQVVLCDRAAAFVVESAPVNQIVSLTKWFLLQRYLFLHEGMSYKHLDRALKEQKCDLFALGGSEADQKWDTFWRTDYLGRKRDSWFDRNENVRFDMNVFRRLFHIGRVLSDHRLWRDPTLWLFNKHVLCLEQMHVFFELGLWPNEPNETIAFFHEWVQTFHGHRSRDENLTDRKEYSAMCLSLLHLAIVVQSVVPHPPTPLVFTVSQDAHLLMTLRHKETLALTPKANITILRK